MTDASKPIRILMLNYEFPPIGGGAANANLCLLREYAERNDVEVDMLTSAPEPGFQEQQFAENVRLYKVGIRKPHLHFWKRSEVLKWLLKAGRRYGEMVRENSYDLAHAFFGFPTGWLCYRRAEKLPYVISLRGSDVPGGNARLQLDYKILGPVFRRIWERASELVACSEGLRRRAVEFEPSARIEVIPNGVDLNRFRPAETPRVSDPVRLITVGRLSATKRVDLLIDAVGMLHKSGLAVRLVVAGGGKLQQQLQQEVWDKSLGEVVRLAGRVDPRQMPKLYRASDIFVSASMQEGMSNAMLEAMACGLPIITTACEGTEELIGDNGIVVGEATADQMAIAIRQLAENSHLYETMSLAARERAEQFSWARTADEYVELYRRLL